MREKIKVLDRISVRILIMLMVLFTIAAVIVSFVNRYNIRRLYEENFTQRVLLTNALMANIVDSEDINIFVELIKAQDDEFKRRQVRFYHDRELFWVLQEAGAPEEELQEIFDRLQEFYYDMAVFKNDLYWEIVSELQILKEVSNSTYLYVMADTGLVSDDGYPLYTFIFDAEDTGVFSEDADTDGLGTCDNGEESIIDVLRTGKQMEWVYHYDGGYGELYYAYAPIFNSYGEAVAVFGTDLDIGTMNESIAAATRLFNMIFLVFFLFMVIIIVVFLQQSILEPLSSLTNTAHELAEGNVYSPTADNALRQRGEIGVLARAINDMSFTYQEMIGSTGKLFNAASIGKLDVRNDSEKFKGDIKNVIQQINDTLDSMTLYLNSIPESILIMSKDIETHFQNDCFTKTFGDIPALEFLSNMFRDEDYDELTAPQRRDSLKEKLSGMLEQEDYNETIWLNDFCFSIILHEIDLIEDIENSILVVARDITDLMNEKENAQAAAKAKSNFLSRMSHEMRTPMNAIIGMTKIAETTDDTSKLQYCINTIGSSSEQLLGIINDVLDMSKIDAGKFELESRPMNIEKTLTKVSNIIVDKMKEKKQRFEMILPGDMSMDFIGDELRISQVITNLLSNAVKFTPENGIITLKVEKAGENENRQTLRFSVNDTGIGMTIEQTTRLWGAFEQADGGTTRRFGGTGLGLAISKSIVEMMGGQIWVESEPGVGSTFLFEIDLERAGKQKQADKQEQADNRERADKQDYAADAEAPGKIPDLSDISIILAEDVDINREVFLALLENTQLKIDTAENGLIAVKKFEENPDKYDLIVMDIQMPEMDGFQATKAIRSLDIPRAKTIPIIAMTANAFKEDIEQCLESGMNDHLAKPIDEKAVIAKIIHYTKK